MSLAGFATFNSNLRKLMDSPAFKSANDSERMRMGDALLRSKYGIGSVGGFGPVSKLPSETETRNPDKPPA